MKTTDKLPAKLQKVDDWFKENVKFQGSSVTLTKREIKVSRPWWSKDGTYHPYSYTTQEDVKIPFKAATLAEYLQAKAPELRVNISQTSSLHGRQGSNGVYYSQSTRNGTQIEVYDLSQPIEKGEQYHNWTGHRRIFEHDTTETYRNNSEIVTFIAKYLKGIK